MNEAGWARWRVAETSLANGVDVATAAKDLPPTQAWILRATDAVERGDRGALESLMSTTPGGNYLALIEVALSHPGDIDPTRLRAQLKSAGVQNKPFPRLDLARLGCVAHNGAYSTRVAGLAKAMADRMVLRCALMVLSPTFTAYQAESHLVERSPRMARLWAAGIAQLLAPGRVRDWMSKNLADLGELPKEAWPDLEKPIEGAHPRRRHGIGLEQFLSNPDHVDWNQQCDDDIDDLCRVGNPKASRDALGRLLDTIHRLVQSPMPARACPLTYAAARLVEDLQHVAHSDVIIDQLQRLDLRLGWTQQTLPEPAVEFLWDGLRSTSIRATPDERMHAARQILAQAKGHHFSAPILTSLLASALREPADWRKETLPWLRDFGHSVSIDQLTVALRGAPAPYRLRVLGTLQALQRKLPAALSLAAQLLAAGAVVEASGVVELAVSRRDESADGRQSRRLLRKAILEFAEAGQRSDPPPGARVLDLLLTLAAEDSDATPGKSLGPVVARRLRVEPEPPYRELCAHLRLLHTADLNGPCADIFRTFGRWLRRASRNEAIDSALCFCAAISSVPDVVECYASDKPDDKALQQPVAWLRSITQWLEHQPASAVEAQAMTLATTGECEPVALFYWFDEVSDLPHSDGWERVEALIMDEAFGGMPDLNELVEMFGLGGGGPF